MADNILPFAGSPPDSTDDAFRVAMQRAQKRVLGAMAIVRGMAGNCAGDEFNEEGLDEVAHILDDIAGDMYAALHHDPTASGAA